MWGGAGSKEFNSKEPNSRKASWRRCPSQADVKPGRLAQFWLAEWQCYSFGRRSLGPAPEASGDCLSSVHLIP